MPGVCPGRCWNFDLTDTLRCYRSTESDRLKSKAASDIKAHSLRSNRFRGAKSEERGFRRFARAKNGARANKKDFCVSPPPSPHFSRGQNAEALCSLETLATQAKKHTAFSNDHWRLPRIELIIIDRRKRSKKTEKLETHLECSPKLGKHMRISFVVRELLICQNSSTLIKRSLIGCFFCHVITNQIVDRPVDEAKKLLKK